MPMFIDPTQRVQVSDDRGNVVWVKAAMDAATRAAVQDEIRARGLAVGETLEVRGVGSYRLALLIHNVVAWEGPDFVDSTGTKLACNRYWIERWNPRDPLYEQVAEKIGELNEPAESPDPNAIALTGSIIDGVAYSTESA